MVGTCTLGYDAPSLSTVQLNSRGVGRALKMTQGSDVVPQPPPKNIDCVHHMVINDRHFNVNQIYVTYAVGISWERVVTILHNKLSLSKVSAQWVPRLWTFDQKHTRLVMSQANLPLLKQIQPVVLNISSPKMSFGSTTSSQRSNNNPCSGNTSLLPLQRRPRWCHRQRRWWPPFSGMQRALCSLITFRKAKSSMGNTMPNYWGKLRKAIMSKRPGKLMKGFLFHQDNAPAHKSVVAMAAVHDCGFELVDHPPYSPDLVPSDYFLFPSTKKHFSGKQYRTDEEVICWGLFRRSGWELLYHRNPSAATLVEEVFGLQGDYIEKWTTFWSNLTIAS